MHRGQTVVVENDLIGDIPKKVLGQEGRVMGRSHLNDDFSNGERAYEVSIEGFAENFVFWESELKIND